ncbi:hypothetical protein P43SY_009472 [Pythium insidiosum]|uniref:Uncharacterized protein n=1 Tax=Pythium insidiosum TaxID=114742 RepID=A0AAD5LYB6_PYTIN|nr:hypothetical protein P43SY_009472 [Pythium insidiosum]
MWWPWRAISVEHDKLEATHEALAIAVHVECGGVELFVRHKKQQWHCRVLDWPALHRDDAQRKQLLDVAPSASLGPADLARVLYFGAHTLACGAVVERRRLRWTAAVDDAKAASAPCRELLVQYALAPSSAPQGETLTLLELALALALALLPHASHARGLGASPSRPRKPSPARVASAKSCVKTFPTRFVNWAIDAAEGSWLRAVADGLQVRERGDYELTLAVDCDAATVVVELDGECLSPDASHGGLQLFRAPNCAAGAVLRVLVVDAPAPCDAELTVRQCRRARRARLLELLQELLLAGLADDGSSD